MKARKEKNKEYKDLVPETGKREFLKRKAQSSNSNDNQKQRRFDNSRSGGNSWQTGADYNNRGWKSNNRGSYSKFSGHQKKSNYSSNGVNSFRTKSKKY